jgi:hypothetical protein
MSRQDDDNAVAIFRNTIFSSIRRDFLSIQLKWLGVETTFHVEKSTQIFF